MAYYLDYSAAKLSGSTIRSAGYTGVIRYIDRPDLWSAKHTNATEYASLTGAGLTVHLVMQTTTTASDGGYATGVNHGSRALAGSQALGYNGPVFFTNDRPDLPGVEQWRAYLDGARDVLGIERVGAYGFRNAMLAARGYATYFWQAGRRSDLVDFANFWQDNNTQVSVGGITCDRNLVLIPIEEIIMAKQLVLVREADTGAVWVCDHIWRRHVQDQAELDGLKWWVQQRGGNPNVADVTDVRVFGRDVDTRPVVQVNAGDIVPALAEQLRTLRFTAE